MNPSSEPGQIPSRPPTGGWRYGLGLALLVLSLSLPLLALVVVPLLGLPEGVNAALFALSLAGGPDILLVLAAAAMGRENIDRIAGKVGPWLRRLLRWDEVTRRRYVVGLWILSLSVVLPFAIALFFEGSIVSANGAPGWAYYVIIATYFSFAASFLMMGAPLWDRVRAIFEWDATITFPPSAGRE